MPCNRQRDTVREGKHLRCGHPSRREPNYGIRPEILVLNSNSIANHTGWPKLVTPCIFLAMYVAQALFYVLLTVVQDSAVQPTANSFESVAKQAEEARTANRLSEAVKLYSKGVRLRPSWSEGWWSLASVLYEQDRFAEAQVTFNRFVKLTPRPGPAYAFLALCEYEGKEFESALRHFEMWSKNRAPGTDALIRWRAERH